jgi:hypothetical protein
MGCLLHELCSLKSFDDILYGYKNIFIPSKDEELNRKENASLNFIQKMNVFDNILKGKKKED